MRIQVQKFSEVDACDDNHFLFKQNLLDCIICMPVPFDHASALATISDVDL